MRPLIFTLNLFHIQKTHVDKTETHTIFFKTFLFKHQTDNNSEIFYILKKPLNKKEIDFDCSISFVMQNIIDISNLINCSMHDRIGYDRTTLMYFYHVSGIFLYQILVSNLFISTFSSEAQQ